MSQDESEWATIEIEKPEQEKIEFEVESQEEQAEDVAASSEKELLEDVDNEPEKISKTENKKPEELEGVETKGAQKRIRQLIKQRKEREEEIAQLRAEMQELRKSVQTKDTELTNSLKNSLDSTEQQLASRLENAREAFKMAVDQGDTERMLSAQEELSKTYAQATALEQQKRAWEEYNERVKAAQENQREQSQQQEATPQYDPLAVQWAGNNPWFGQDQIMTAAALAIDSELKSEGYDPSDEDFYEEVDNRLRVQFPAKYQAQAEQVVKQEQPERVQNVTSNSAQVVAGASRTPKTSSGSKIKLSQEDVRLAQKWGIPLEKYAAEKLKVEQADGEYTNV